MTTNQKTSTRGMLVAAFLTLGLALVAGAETAQRKFARPEAAVDALVTAAQANDKAAMVTILGPESEDVVSSGDPVADENVGKRVVAAAKERTRFEALPSGAMIARLGKDDWPLPIPLVKDGNEWRFDTASGRDEILNRRIGRNEIGAIRSAAAYVDAQRAYFALEGSYAQKVRSDEGKRDGLFWESDAGNGPSPLGPFFAEASAEGYGKQPSGSGPQPYHGYVFRILTEQGASAPGGAKSYVKDGKMTGGFALVASPAEPGSSGVMTFIVGPQGIIYQKNLGEKTAELAKAMTAYDPDESWVPTRSE